MTNDTKEQTSGLPGAVLGVVIAALVLLLFHRFGVTDLGHIQADASPSIFMWLTAWWVPHSSIGDDVPYTWIVPFIALWMVWRLRHELAGERRAPNWMGFAVIVFALLLHFAGARAQQTRVSLVAFALLAWAIPFHLYGWPVARKLLVPCGLLLFLVPPDFFDQFTTRLRAASAVISGEVLRGLGLPVVVVDTFTLRTEGADPKLAPLLPATTGGLRSAAFILVVSILLAWMRLPGLVRKLVLVSLAPALLVVVNVAFATLVFIAADTTGSAATFVANQPAYYLLAFGVLWVAHRCVRRSWSARQRTAEPPSEKAEA